jgi:hypothetical protein
MKYNMRIDPIWRPLLLVGGATAANSYAEIEGAELRIRYGLFRHTLQLANVASAAGRSWPLWGGIGWRAWGEQLGLIGSTENVVELQLNEAERFGLGFVPWPFGVRRIAISLEDPQAFIDALTAAT